MDLIYSFAAYTESWIEVSSRPSSSSLSSAATDEVVTTGLRVSQDSNARRRRRLYRSATTQLQGRIAMQPFGANGSSQDEYDESESESDKVMSSSNEDMRPRFLVEEEQSDDSRSDNQRSRRLDDASIHSLEDDDDDENATALGPVDPSPAFTPQPNAFSHPPSARLNQRSTSHQDSYFPPTSPSGPVLSRLSRPNTSDATSAPSTLRAHHRTRSHTPFNAIAPNHSIDHDAALRASLSTLLSCAAAARGLQKREGPGVSGPGPSRAPLQRTQASSRVEQGTLRLVPESALDRVEEQAKLPRNVSPSTAESPGSPSSGSVKRKSKSPARERRKKQRFTAVTPSEDLMNISPTLTTWVVGAGVLVLFSAITFSAGYALGKEVGRVDAIGTGASLGCSSEAEGALGRTLIRSRAWRWGNTSGVRA